ncbi:MAG: hypothetical protein IJ783_06150 [Kiritimatiellae bacterium]|nr:hypothetical protein [Kiritimatiellia bacterium]
MPFSRSKTVPAGLAVPALALLFCSGCFDRAKPAEDVVARSPEEAAGLSKTVSFLDLHECESLSAFPEGLAEFPELRRLSVRGRTAAATVPESISEAKGLRELDLAATGLRDLPDSLASLGALRSLYLSDNGLASLPEPVCGLSGLTYLNLDRNALASLPDSVGGMASLKWVRLNGNRLEDLPPSASGWKDVRRLYLRGNKLRRVPDAVLAMASLEEIDLGDNDIGEVPDALFRLPNLARVDLDGNARLAKLPDGIADAKALKHLFLSGCSIPEEERDRIRKALPDPVRQFIAF